MKVKKLAVVAFAAGTVLATTGVVTNPKQALKQAVRGYGVGAALTFAGALLAMEKRD